MRVFVKFFSLLFFLSIIKFSLYAQSSLPSLSLAGKIVDSLTHEPISYAVVSMSSPKSDRPFKEMITDNNGQFEFKNVATGEYILSVNFIGYRRKTISHINVSNQVSKISLPTIELSSLSQTLNEVSISGNKPVFENKIDKFIYNPENESTTIMGDATDLLRKVPMLVVDMNGNVALRGNSNVRILIDGKATGAMSGNVGDILQSIPATQIKRVEVITSPSAKYDAEGSGGIINIITNRKMLEGVAGLVAAGIGTRQTTSSIGLSAKMQKLTVNVNAGINNKWPRNVDVDFYSYDANGNHSSSIGKAKNSRLSNNSAVTLQYDLNDNDIISSTFRSTSLGYNNDMNSNGLNESKPNSLITYDLKSKSKTRASGFDWSGDYLHKFKKKDEELFFATQWSQNISTQNFSSLYSNAFNSQKADNKGNNNEYTLQADYTLPINKTVKLEVGAKSIFRKIQSNYNYFNIDTVGNNIFDPLSSNIYNYSQNVYAGYVVLEFDLKSGWAVQLGNRVEFTNISGQSKNDQTKLSPFVNNYSSYIPGFILSRALDDHQNIKLSYNKRIQRPSLQYLNPFRNTNDPLNQSEGTPDLTPEREQTVELHYDSFIKKFSLNVSLYYKRTDDLIQSFVKTIPYITTDASGASSTRLVSLTKYGNIGFNNSYGLNLFTSVDLNTALSLRGSFNIYTFNPKVYTGYSSFLNPGVFLQYNGFFGGTYKFNHGLALESSYSFMSKVRTFQGTTANLNILNVGVKREILKHKGTIGLVVVNPIHDKWNFTDYIQTKAITLYSNLSTPFRSFNINFSYKFGKLKSSTNGRHGVNNDDLKKEN